MLARWIFVGAAILVCGCANHPNPTAPETLPHDTTAISAPRNDDPELKGAIAKARAGLDGFIRRLQHPQAREVFSVEALFLAEDGTPQYLWLDVTGSKGDTFEGVITSHPKKATKVKYGDTVHVPRADVTDWMILTSGHSEGGYTTDVLLRREAQPH